MKQASPDPKLQPGLLIGGKYRVLRVIAQGGMGAISLCTHEELEQRVAVKTLLPELLSDEDSRARFVREARAAAKLQSQNVARVSDVGTDPEIGPYMVMEYLEGTNLDEQLSLRGTLPVTEVVDWVLEAIDAIAEAHSLGIVHRDLKPSNLFLADRSDGKRIVKVLDFGISKVASGGVQSQVLTGTSTVVGSPVYMAPEQLKESRNVDQRADVWSLGVVLYELLCGVRPFEGDSLAVLFVQVLEREPMDVVARRPDVPPALGAAIMRCLRKDLEQRMPNVAELASAIAPFGTGRVSGSVGRARSLLVDTARTQVPTTAPMPGRPAAGGSQPNIAPSQPSLAPTQASQPSHPSQPSQPSHPVDIGARTQSGWQQQPTPTAPSRSKVPVFLGVSLLLAVLGIGGGGVAYYKRTQAKQIAPSTTANAPPPASEPTTPPVASAASVANAAAQIASTSPSSPPTPPSVSASASAVAVAKAGAKPPIGAVRGGKPGKPGPTAAVETPPATTSPAPAPVPTDPNDFLDRRH